MKLKIGDIFIIAAVALVAFCLLLGKHEQGDFAVLKVDGEIVKTFDLSIDTQYTYLGEYQNVITVKNSEISITSSTCPDKTCVETHAVSAAGGVICCLPNKLLISIVNDKPEVDVVSG